MLFRSPNNSESREWYFVSSLIISLALVCYFIVAIYALPDQSEIFPLLTTAINLSFFLLGLSGVFLGLQGYNFRNNKAVLVRLEGEEVALKIESLFLKNNLEIKGKECSNLIDNGEKVKSTKNIEVLPISGLMGEAIKRISNSTSVSDLFK